MLILTVDVEPDFPPFYDTNLGITGLEKITGLLKKNHSTATFFVTASYLLENPKIKEILSGFEIGCHGLEHIDYTQLDKNTITSHLKEAKQIFLDLGIPVTGFRAPYAKVNQDVLDAASKYFMYDSSKTFWHHGKYEIEEYPLYTGGKMFGVNPYLFKKIVATNIKTKVFFIHPWEFGGFDFKKITEKRRWLKLFGYSQNNYFKNISYLLKQNPTSIISSINSFNTKK